MEVVKWLLIFVEGILSEEEYELKVSKIRNTVEEQITQQKLEEKNLSRMIKLKQALESGILTQAEYEAKVAGFQTNIL